MTERTARQVLMSYRDVDGATRHALQGEVIDVRPDHVKEFDAANGTEDTRRPPPMHNYAGQGVHPRSIGSGPPPDMHENQMSGMRAAGLP